MPSIKISEIDLTKGGGAAGSSDIVYVPGFMSIIQNYPNPEKSAWLDGTETAAAARTPILCDSISKFEECFGSKPHYFTEDVLYEVIGAEGIDGIESTDVFIKKGEPDKSYLYAKELISLGIPVLYESMNDVDTEPSVSDLYRALASDCYLNLSDMGEYDVKYITSGGYPIFELKSTETKTVENYTIGTSVTVSVGDDVKNESKAFSLFCDGEKWKVYNTVNDTEIEDTNYTFMIDEANSNETLNKFVFKCHKAEESVVDFVVSEFTLTFDNDNRHYVSGDVLKIEVKAGTTTKSSTPVPTVTTEYKYLSPTINVNMEMYLLKSEGLVLSDVTDSTVSEWTPTIFDYDGDKWNNNSPDANDGTLSDYGIVLKGDDNSEFIPHKGDTLSITLDISKSESSNGIATKMTSLAANRGDCVALLDHLDRPDRKLVGNLSVYESFRKFGKANSNSDFAAAFTPWVNISCTSYIPPVGTTNTTFSMPPSLGYLLALAKSIKTNANWIAVAGATRGQIPNLSSDKPLNINSRLTNAIAEERYQNRDDVSINAITNINPFGYRIWGNRTLKHNGVERNVTATSFLNVRNMVSDIKKVVYATCKRYTFEQNNDILWTNFKAGIEPTLEQMKSGAGLSGYKIIKNPTTEKAKLIATIKLYPLYAVEDFEITVTMEDEEIAVS